MWTPWDAASRSSRRPRNCSRAGVFHGVSVGDLGRRAGWSGPALYKHFASKEAILAEMLVRISEELLRVGTERVASAGDGTAAVTALVEWHVDSRCGTRR